MQVRIMGSLPCHVGIYCVTISIQHRFFCFEELVRNMVYASFVVPFKFSASWYFQTLIKILIVSERNHFLCSTYYMWKRLKLFHFKKFKNFIIYFHMMPLILFSWVGTSCVLSHVLHWCSLDILLLVEEV